MELIECMDAAGMLTKMRQVLPYRLLRYAFPYVMSGTDVACGTAPEDKNLDARCTAVCQVRCLSPLAAAPPLLVLTCTEVIVI